MGTITVWLLFIIFCIGIILVSVKLFKNIDVDSQFVKLIVVLEFMARSSLINVNFGHLLFQFFDRIFSFDMWFMWKIIDERGIRGRLGGRLDEYKLPTLMINANMLALTFYLVRYFIPFPSNFPRFLPFSTLLRRQHSRPRRQ